MQFQDKGGHQGAAHKKSSTQGAAEVKRLIKEELRLQQNQICAKDETLCRPGPKGSRGRRGRPGTRGRPGLQGKPGPRGPPGNTAAKRNAHEHKI